MSKGFSIDRDSFQEILASAFLVQGRKFDKQVVKSVAELDQLIESDHFSIDRIADLPIEEPPPAPITDTPARMSSERLPSSPEELANLARVDQVLNRYALVGSDGRPLVTVLLILLVLILGWMVGRVTWRRSEIPRTSAIPAEPQHTFNDRERNNESKVSASPSLIRKEKNSRVTSDRLVISQDGKVVFPTAPAEAPSRREPGDTKIENSSDESSIVRVTYKVEPQYPEAAKKQNIQGSVTLDALVDARGSVQQVDVIRGEPILANAATAAIRKWRFSLPTTQSSGNFVVHITVNFRLRR
jgi:TonB family protein